MKKLSFLQNTIVLVISNLITGSLTFLFSIILSKEIGAQGVGIYQIIMPVYSLFICFACGGTTTALSKIVAEQSSRKNTNELYKSVSISITFFSIWSSLISIIIVLSSGFISLAMLKDARTFLGLLAFVPALVCVAIGSVLKGYFYGLQNSSFPALIDILEKAVRIIVLLTLVNLLRPMGLKYQIAGAVFAMTAGELTSCTLLYIFYKKSYFNVKQFTGVHDNVIQIIANVLKISVPLCINGFILTMLGTFVTLMIPRRLQDAGFSAETSLALFGKVSGMSMNIITFPFIIVGAICTLLVPVISEATSGKSMTATNRKILYTIKLTALIACASAGIFFALSWELGKLFYSRNDLGSLIFSLSFGVVFSYIESTLISILNGLGKQMIILRNTLILSTIDIVLLYTLIGIPRINIYGYAINFVISPFVGCILNAYEVQKSADIDIKLAKILLLPCLAAFGQIFALTKLKPVILKIAHSQAVAALSLIVLGIGLYTVLYLILSASKKNLEKI